ncbi:peptidylprolyl isomerase [Candidatus Parvarchaeota archaeon]|jgi:FKBP-type peptidyl-prolyl cis-trans isomerase 2|nr:peptidylprolyl isomerase [Candidatus Parvarchaeota archaeon]
MSSESTVKLHINRVYIFVIVVVVAVLIASFYFLSHNISTVSVKSGDNVTVFYSLWLSNGTLIQTDFNSTPFSFIAGSSQVIKGFSNAVIGMKDGQVKNVTLSPAEAYGNVNDSLIITVPKSDFGNSSLYVGEHVSNPNGATGVITALNSTSVIVNFNSPLAGKTLIFEIKVVKIN